MGDQKATSVPELKPALKPAAPSARRAQSVQPASASARVPLSGNLSNGALMHPTAAAPRAALLRRTQRQRGNAFVKRAVDQAHTADQVSDAAIEHAVDDRSAGQPLDASTRLDMAGLFGRDLGGVRVHTDARADVLSRDLSADAFTRGEDVYFAAGRYAPGTSSGQRLLTHELTHVVQQGEGQIRYSREVSEPTDAAEVEAETIAGQIVAGVTATPLLPQQAVAGLARQVPLPAPQGQTPAPAVDNSAVNTAVDLIIDRLEGYTSSSDSAEILQQFQGKSPAMVRAILQELKNRASQYDQTPDGMIDWLFGDMTAEDRRSLRQLLAQLGVVEDLGRIVANEIKNRLSGYTSAADSTEIYAAITMFNGAGVDTVLQLLQGLTGRNAQNMEEWLFGDLDRATSERLRQFFFQSGGPLAMQYAAYRTADKIVDLLAGYTSHADSSAIVWNLERTPGLVRPIIMGRLNQLTLQRWSQTAEDALMADMDQSDYEMLRTLAGIQLRAYDRQRGILERVLSGAEWAEVVLEVAAGGIIGIITGVLSVIWDILKLVKDIIVVAWDLLWSFFYLVSAGAVGSQEWLDVKDFFRGLGALTDDPGKIMRQAWEETKLESATIEGPFEYGRRAEFWTRKVVNVIVNILLVLLAGYGAVKGVAAAVTEVAELSETVGTVRAIGIVARRALRAAGRMIAVAADRAGQLIQALARPLELLAQIRQQLNIILLFVQDEDVWSYARGAVRGRIENEREFWQNNRERWRQMAIRQQAREAELSGEANDLQTNLQRNQAPDQPDAQIRGIEQDANQLQSEVNNLQRDVNGEPRPGAPNVAALSLEDINRDIDRILTWGPELEPPASAELQGALARLRAGQLTPADQQILLRQVLAESRAYAMAQNKILDYEALRGSCGPGRDVSAAAFGSMASESPVPSSVARFQAADVFGVNQHAFSVVTFPDGTQYLVDPTFGQFLYPSSNLPIAGATAQGLRADAAGARFLRELLQNGFVELTSDNAALYARAMGADPAQAARVAPRLFSGENAVAVETVGQGRTTALSFGTSHELGRAEITSFLNGYIIRLEREGDPGNLLPLLRQLLVQITGPHSNAPFVAAGATAADRLRQPATP